MHSFSGSTKTVASTLCLISGLVMKRNAKQSATRGQLPYVLLCFVKSHGY